jgi:hypothetical protein
LLAVSTSNARDLVIATNEGELARRDPLVHEGLEQLDLEAQAWRRVGHRGEGPHRERLPVSIGGEARGRAVRPAPFGPDLAHEARGERAAEDGVCDAERNVVRVERRSAERADEDLRLRALRLVDEDEAPSFLGLRLDDGVGEADAFGDGAEESFGYALGRAFVHVPGEAEHEVSASHVNSVRPTRVGLDE